MARLSDELTDTQGTVDIDRDRALVLRCQEGDSAAFAELYTRYYERLLRFCRRRLGDAEAEDVAQDAFVRAWRALPRFVGERRFYPWLTVIAGNLCTDVLRKRSRTVSESGADLDGRCAALPDEDVTPEERLVAAADGELAQKALQRLTLRHRRVLALREGSELTYQQIATREGMDVSAVETLLWRARQALKREFAALNASGAASAVFGLGLVAALRRGWIRTGHSVAALGRRVTSSGFRGVPVREAVVALAVTSAAITGGAQLLHGASAAPAHPSSSIAAPDRLAGDHAKMRVMPTAGGVDVAPVTPSAAAPSGGGATAVPAATVGGAGAQTPTAAASPSLPALPSALGGAGPSVPALPSLTQPAVPPGVSGLTGAVQSTLSPVTSAASPVATVTAPVSSGVASTVGAVGDTLSAARATVSGAVPSLASPLSGLLGSAPTGG